tara:strand:- start:213 stop:899 length:687 start_codon:yes stop_codon:yes gene_type:complete
MSKNVLIIGVGGGLSASLARIFKANGFSIGLVSRNIKKIKSLGIEVSGELFQCDASNSSEVQAVFNEVDMRLGALDLVIYNPSKRTAGSIVDLDIHDVKSAMDITCYGGFLVAQQAAKRMLKRGSGAIFFTGASASVKGFPNSSVFAMGKFGLRGLAQSLARELHPKNIHIGHFVIDGSIARFSESKEKDLQNNLDPDEIAKSYLHFFMQNKNCWSWELELRPWLEKF